MSELKEAVLNTCIYEENSTYIINGTDGET